MAKTMAEVQAGVSKIPRVMMTTKQYSVGDNYEYSQAAGKEIKSGFKSAMSISLEIDDLSALAQVLALGEIRGVSQLSGLHFDVRDRKSAQMEAITEAVKDGLRKAGAMAVGFGKSGADVLRLQEEEVQFSDPFYFQTVVVSQGFLRVMSASLVAREGGGNEPFIIPANVEIRASVVLLTKLR